MNITIENLNKVYGDKTVLDIASLTLVKHKIYGIVGPNGAGKSTMLRIIAGLEEATGGKMLYNGNPLNTQMIKNLTFMGQRPYLLRTSVFNNIVYPLKLRKCSTKIIHNKVNDIMKELKVFDLRDQLATSLSGGESQKIALARALIFEPNLLLLDEPTANIDPNSIELIEKTITKRNKKCGMTTIIITHNMGQAKRLCDEVIFINRGRIIEEGIAQQVLFNPKHSETKRFLSLYI